MTKVEVFKYMEISGSKIIFIISKKVKIEKEKMKIIFFILLDYKRTACIILGVQGN